MADTYDSLGAVLPESRSMHSVRKHWKIAAWFSPFNTKNPAGQPAGFCFRFAVVVLAQACPNLRSSREVLMRSAIQPTASQRAQTEIITSENHFPYKPSGENFSVAA